MQELLENHKNQTARLASSEKPEGIYLHYNWTTLIYWSRV